jgi:hypothetical protein
VVRLGGFELPNDSGVVVIAILTYLFADADPAVLQFIVPELVEAANAYIKMQDGQLPI